MSRKAAVKTSPKHPGSPLPEELVRALASLSDDNTRKSFLGKHPELVCERVIDELSEAVRRHVRVDPRQALALAEFTAVIAQQLNNPEASAQSLLAKSNGLYAMGQNREAVQHNAQSVAIFRSLGKKADVARALNSSIQPHLLLGEYEQAMAAAEEARQIFLEEGNEWRVARVEVNTGNIFQRQDRFVEALACYERAYQYFLPHKEKDPEAVAVALHNQAMCLISLNDFPRALAAYEEARTFAVEHNMPTIAGHADYNIAWLYYLRGEYGTAIDMLRAARETCRHNGDRYHFALCHMDLSEIYLELNLSSEAAEMAQEGAKLFEQIGGHGYETAKCLANLAIAYGQNGQTLRAIEVFAQAREMFVREQNQAWPSLIDLYKALLLFNEGRLLEARQLCAAALEFFSNSILPGKTVLCRLLMARLHAQLGDLHQAIGESKAALAMLATTEMPVLSYQAQFLVGKLQLAEGKTAEAYESYQRARSALENLRSALHSEELKISFMKNKLEVYEELIELCLPDDGRQAEAFLYMEQAKSRSLLDSMFRAGSASVSVPGQSDLATNIAELREELNWYYHRIEIEQLRQEKHSPERVSELVFKARQREDELLRILREGSAAGGHPELRTPVAVGLPQIQAELEADETLLEYFFVRDRILVALLSRESLEIVAVSAVPKVRSLLRLLQFQLSKLRLGPEYTETFGRTFLEATQDHLHQLYQELIAPLRPQLKGRHLIVVPHDLLHYLPFAALFDGERYLIDSFSVSYAPSASIHALSSARASQRAGPALLLGVPDETAPCIADEIHSVAATVPDAQVFLGKDATAEVLRQKGQQSRFIHIATHGFFRPDNPMFSGIRLGDSRLSLYDLYQLKWPAELVTLSGCATGLNVIASGDELLGLARGLIYAGAHSVLLTLWDVHDRSSAEFMKAFYRRLLTHPHKGAALQGAMLELRERYPHPYHWAPFTLVGKVASN